MLWTVLNVDQCHTWSDDILIIGHASLPRRGWLTGHDVIDADESLTAASECVTVMTVG